MKKVILSACVAAVVTFVIGKIAILFSDPDPETTRRLYVLAIGAPFAVIFLRMYMTQSKFHAVPRGHGLKMTILATIVITAGCIFLT